MIHSTRRSRSFAGALRRVAPALLVVAMTCAAAQAQPTSRPGMAMPARPNMRGGGGGGGGGPVNAEDVAAALEFAREHMPNLARIIEEAEPGSLTRRKMVRFAIERWRSVERVQREDPDEYDAALARAASHDEVFDLIRQLDEAAPEQRPALRAELREKMRQIMLDLLEERERRIEGLRRMLGREEDLLSRDREKIDELTERRIEMLQQEMRGGGVPKSAGDLTPPDLSTAPAMPIEPAPSTAPSHDRPRRGQ
jgi:hypothetical protein